MDAMYQHDAIVGQGLVYERAGPRKVDEEVGVVDILNGDTQLPDPRCRVVGRYGL